MDFKWIPGQGINQDAIDRIQDHITRPVNVIDAFVFGEEDREQFQTLVNSELNRWNLGIADSFLSEVNAHRLHKYWHDWILYMLRAFVSTSPDGQHTVDLVNAFIHARQLFDPGLYIGFHNDLLQTRGMMLMAPQYWDGDDLSNEWWEFDCEMGRYDCEFYDLLHSQMFLVLSYIKESAIPGWVQSIAAIAGEQWQFEVNLWLSKLAKFHYYIHHPSEAKWPGWRPQSTPDRDKVAYYIEAAGLNWHPSSVGQDIPIDNIDDFIPMTNIETFMAEVKKYPSLELDYDWTG
ncbi:MAG: hypothetical protein L0154_25690 [Chloroflexi bacterium]|nr:hypothetical protein [Chloroflexota bacterium]